MEGKTTSPAPVGRGRQTYRGPSWASIVSGTAKTKPGADKQASDDKIKPETASKSPPKGVQPRQKEVVQRENSPNKTEAWPILSKAGPTEVIPTEGNEDFPITSKAANDEIVHAHTQNDETSPGQELTAPEDKPASAANRSSHLGELPDDFTTLKVHLALQDVLVQEQKAEVTSLQTDLAAREERLRQQSDEITGLREKLATQEKVLQEVEGRDTAADKEREVERDTLAKELSAQREAFSRLSTMFASNQIKHDQVESELAAARDELRLANSQMDDMRQDHLETEEDLRDRISNLELRYMGLLRSLNDANADLEELQPELRRRGDHLRELSQGITHIRLTCLQGCDALQDIVKLYSDGGHDEHHWTPAPQIPEEDIAIYLHQPADQQEIALTAVEDSAARTIVPATVYDDGNRNSRATTSYGSREGDKKKVDEYTGLSVPNSPVVEQRTEYIASLDSANDDAPFDARVRGDSSGFLTGGAAGISTTKVQASEQACSVKMHHRCEGTSSGSSAAVHSLPPIFTNMPDLTPAPCTPAKRPHSPSDESASFKKTLVDSADAALPPRREAGKDASVPGADCAPGEENSSSRLATRTKIVPALPLSPKTSIDRSSPASRTPDSVAHESGKGSDSGEVTPVAISEAAVAVEHNPGGLIEQVTSLTDSVSNLHSRIYTEDPRIAAERNTLGFKLARQQRIWPDGNVPTPRPAGRVQYVLIEAKSDGEDQNKKKQKTKKKSNKSKGKKKNQTEGLTTSASSAGLVPDAAIAESHAQANDGEKQDDARAANSAAVSLLESRSSAGSNPALPTRLRMNDGEKNKGAASKVPVVPTTGAATSQTSIPASSSGHKHSSAQANERPTARAGSPSPSPQKEFGPGNDEKHASPEPATAQSSTDDEARKNDYTDSNGVTGDKRDDSDDKQDVDNAEIVEDKLPIADAKKPPKSNGEADEGWEDVTTRPKTKLVLRGKTKSPSHATAPKKHPHSQDGPVYGSRSTGTIIGSKSAYSYSTTHSRSTSQADNADADAVAKSASLNKENKTTEDITKKTERRGSYNPDWAKSSRRTTYASPLLSADDNARRGSDGGAHALEGQTKASWSIDVPLQQQKKTRRPSSSSQNNKSSGTGSGRAGYKTPGEIVESEW